MIDEYIGSWEEKLARVDDDFKQCGSFRLGSFDGLRSQTFPNTESMIAAVNRACLEAERFFGNESAQTTFRLNKNSLSFQTSMPNGTLNDTVSVKVFTRTLVYTKAVIIVPHWNAGQSAYDAMAKVLCRLGFSVFVLTLPHHGSRSGSMVRQIANDFLNADLGAAIASVRQAVSDVRSLTTWLYSVGAKDVHLIGVSLGSCVAAMTLAFDQRFSSVSLLLTAGDFAETVWTGRATRHIRAECEGHIDLNNLREVWSIISPSTFIRRFANRSSRLLIIVGRRDGVVPFVLGERFVDELKSVGANNESHVIPCAHYTLAKVPFSLMCLWYTVRFLGKE